MTPMLRSLALALPLVALLTGCSATSAPQVAHLPVDSSPASGGAAAPGAAPGGTPAASSAADRPQLRLDDSDDRVAALVDAYRSCLLDHGAVRATGQTLSPAASAHHIGILVQQPVPAAALAACLHLDPLPPRELNAATNPDFHAESLAWVSCLRQRGIWYTLTDDRDLTATYTPGHAVPDGVDVGRAEQACTLSAFGSGGR